jgi:6-phosphogluconolactonase
MKRVIVDERRQVFVAKTEDDAYDFCRQTLTEEIKKSIAARASCSIALSGGNTPLRLYELFTQPSAALLVNWSLLDIFWCDERCVSPTDTESNFGNALRYLNHPPLDQAKKHRLAGEAADRDMTAMDYEKVVRKVCSGGGFDIVLLGIGEDGHTASLFPKTAALKEEQRLYVPNYVPQKDSWRMTMTFPAIDTAKAVYVLALGKSKAKILKQILFGVYNYEEIPAQKLGTTTNPVYFIIDKKAAYGLGL